MSYEKKIFFNYLVCSSFLAAFNSIEKGLCSTPNQEFLYFKMSELLTHNPTPFYLCMSPTHYITFPEEATKQQLWKGFKSMSHWLPKMGAIEETGVTPRNRALASLEGRKS